MAKCKKRLKRQNCYLKVIFTSASLLGRFERRVGNSHCQPQRVLAHEDAMARLSSIRIEVQPQLIFRDIPSRLPIDRTEGASVEFVMNRNRECLSSSIAKDAAQLNMTTPLRFNLKAELPKNADDIVPGEDFKFWHRRRGAIRSSREPKVPGPNRTATNPRLPDEAPMLP